jgi:hypothetical protein
MKITNNIFFSLLLIINSFFLSAQEKPEFKFDPMTKRNQIGVDSKAIIESFFKETPVVWRFFYKYQYKNLHAFRLGLSGQFSTSKDAGGTNRNSGYWMGVNSGYEWQRIISKRWLWYYGIEGRVGFRYSGSFYSGSVAYNTVPQTSIVKNYENYGLFLSLAPLIGGRFQITDRIYVVVETSYPLTYLRSYDKIKDISSSGSVDNFTPKVIEKSGFIGSQFYSYPQLNSELNLFYLF